MIIIVGEQEKLRLAKLKEYAETHVRSIDDLLDLYNGDTPPVGDNPEHVVTLEPSGLRIVFSVEHQKKGICRHASMSLRNGKLPPVVVAYMMLKELGFTSNEGLYDHVLHHLEEIAPGKHAINFYEYIK
jgi:hypothetical protein